jgi:hypothetical protein
MFEDVLAISDQYECSLNEAIEKIAEANDIPSCLLAVDLKEDMAILYPEVVDEMYQVVISPMAENDPIGIWIESVVNEAIEKDDESIIESAIFGESATNTIGNAIIGAGLANMARTGYKGYKNQQYWKSLGGKYGEALGQFRDPDAIDKQADSIDGIWSSIAAIMVGSSLKSVGQTSDLMDKLYNKLKDRPKNVIAKAIAKLRKSYEKIQEKLNKSPGLFNKESKMVTTLKKVGSKILSTIDKLLRAMQRTANQFS